MFLGGAFFRARCSQKKRGWYCYRSAFQRFVVASLASRLLGGDGWPPPPLVGAAFLSLLWVVCRFQLLVEPQMTVNKFICNSISLYFIQVLESNVTQTNVK